MTKPLTSKQILSRLHECQDILLANLVMMAEKPAPTFGEEERVGFLLDRFRESGLDRISSDEMNNGVGMVPGRDGERTIAVVAHLDTLYDASVSHAVSLGPNRMKGIGLGENSVGAAVLASLPVLLESLGIHFKSNLLLAGVSRGLGRGDLGGIRFLLEQGDMELDVALCMKGSPLGRLNHRSLAMVRGEILCEVPDEFDYSRFGLNGAIVHLNEVMNSILAIARPSRPRTSIIFGSVEGGNTFGELATEARLRFEIRSESDQVVQEILAKIESIVLEVKTRNGTGVSLDLVAHRNSGGLPFDHPLVTQAVEVMNELELTPRVGPSMSELSAFIDEGVPALTLGLTKARNINTRQEEIEIEPLFTGITQVIRLLQELDEGECFHGN